MNAGLVNSYINDIAKRLHNPSQYGPASVMVGAGFSKNAINIDENVLPLDWEELAAKMYESLYYAPSLDADKSKWELNKVKKTSGKNVLKLAEEYKVVFGRNKLDKFIEENINDDKFIPGKLHEKLLELNWNDVFTTNYDTLLEKTIQNIAKRKNYKIILNQNDLLGSTRPRIIKLHGSIPNSKPYIICEEDYRTYPIKYAPFVNTVQQSMLETQLCLIGFSGDDPNFLNWLGWLRDNMGDNCPRIYLCGIFSDMSESEKKMLESQNISVVSLECLIDGSSANPYYDAIEVFLKKLNEYGKEEQELYNKIPYKNNYTDNIDDIYYDELIEYTNAVRARASKYIVLPLDELKQFADELNRQFQKVSRAPVGPQKFVLMGNFAYLLRKLCVPLHDNEALKIEGLIEAFPYESKNLKNDNKPLWFELAIYLAEMYRIDGDNKKYDRIISKIESLIMSLKVQQRADFYIEKCKYCLSRFDYKGTMMYIKKVDESISYEMQIKKACIMSQLGDYEKAFDLLKKCSASLAQRSYSENEMASLVSYMNLCARSLNLSNQLDDFSDQEFYDNKYNVRKMLNDLKLKLSNDLLLAQSKKDIEKRAFNPNSYTYSYGTTPKEIRDTLDDSLRYLILQDSLCLPIQYSRDHKEVIAKAASEIIWTSKNPLWKWSYIIRTNDDNIINNFFTRELIVSSNKEWSEILFDQLILLLRNFQNHENFNGVRIILTQKIIYEVLTRICIVLDNERILKLLDNIFHIVSTVDPICENDIHGMLNRLSYCLNSDILKQSLIRILEIPGSSVHVASYFFDIDVENIDIEIPKELIINSIKEIEERDPKIRDHGISKIILLNEYVGLSGYYKLVADALWNQKNEHGFPKSDMYSVTLWEDLPHDSEISFEKLYVNYLKNPNFPKCVEENTVHGCMNVGWPIYDYMNCVYILSDFQKSQHYKVKWDENIIMHILNYIYDYVDNEKKLLDDRFDIFGIHIEATKRFIHLSDLIALLITQANISKCYNEDIHELLLKIKKLFNEIDIPILSIEIIERLRNKELDNNFEKILKQIMSGSSEEIEQAFTALDIMIVYKESIEDKLNIEGNLEELFKSLKYMDITISCAILPNLSRIIDRKLFLTKEFIKVIVHELTECFDVYEMIAKGINKDYLDAMFNLSELSKKYYIALIKNDIPIPEEMQFLIQRFLNSTLNEVKNAWEMYSKK